MIPSARLRTNDAVTAVEAESAPAVTWITLSPSSPNPFLNGTRLGFTMPSTGQAGGLASGVYFEVLEVAGTQLSKKLLVLC